MSHWSRFRQQVRRRRVSTRTMLLALSEQLNKAAEKQDWIELESERADLRAVARESAIIIRSAASAMHLHGLTHANDKLMALTEREAKAVLAGMDKAKK